jgi:AcrR family transcriptional regulator
MRISKDPVIRKQEILNQARILFEQQGIHETSVAQIADTLNVAKGLIYYYFQSKEDLITALFEQISSQLDQQLDQAINSTHSHFYEQLQRIFDYFFQMIETQPPQNRNHAHDIAFLTRFRDELNEIAFRQAFRVLQRGIETEAIQIRYPEEMLRILIGGLGDLYLNGITDPVVHATLIEQTLGLPSGCISRRAGVLP